MAASSDEVPRKARRPWIAAFLSILATGLGHVYVGRPRRGLLGLLALWLAGALWVVLSMHVHSPGFRVTSFFVLIGVWCAVVADAVRLARRDSPDFVLRPYNRGWVYAALFRLAAFVLQPQYTRVMTTAVGRAVLFPGDMMRPTIVAGDYLLVSPHPRTSPMRGELVVWRDSEGTDFIQRVAAVAGDTAEMRSKVLYVDGLPVEEPYVAHIDSAGDPADPRMAWQEEHLVRSVADYRPSRDNWGPIVIPRAGFLVLGDNRDNSFDGRYRGLVRSGSLVGRPVWIYFSRHPGSGEIRWDRIGRSVR